MEWDSGLQLLLSPGGLSYGRRYGGIGGSGMRIELLLSPGGLSYGSATAQLRIYLLERISEFTVGGEVFIGALARTLATYHIGGSAS